MCNISKNHAENLADGFYMTNYVDYSLFINATNT